MSRRSASHARARTVLSARTVPPSPTLPPADRPAATRAPSRPPAHARARPRRYVERRLLEEKVHSLSGQIHVRDSLESSIEARMFSLFGRLQQLEDSNLQLAMANEEMAARSATADGQADGAPTPLTGDGAQQPAPAGTSPQPLALGTPPASAEMGGAA